MSTVDNSGSLTLGPLGNSAERAGGGKGTQTPFIIHGRGTRAPGHFYPILLVAERKPSAESWRAAGICCRMPLAARAIVSTQGVRVRYLPHSSTDRHFPEMSWEWEGRRKGKSPSVPHSDFLSFGFILTRPWLCLVSALMQAMLGTHQETGGARTQLWNTLSLCHAQP